MLHFRSRLHHLVNDLDLGHLHHLLNSLPKDLSSYHYRNIHYTVDGLELWIFRCHLHLLDHGNLSLHQFYGLVNALWHFRCFLHNLKDGNRSLHHDGNFHNFVIVLHLQNVYRFLYCGYSLLYRIWYNNTSVNELQLWGLERLWHLLKQRQLLLRHNRDVYQSVKSSSLRHVHHLLFCLDARCLRCHTTGTPTTLSMCRTCGISFVFCTVCAVGHKLCCTTGMSSTLSMSRV